MRYYVARAEGDSLFEVSMNLKKDVFELCERGWTLQGGVSITSYTLEDEIHFCMVQALVFFEKRK